MWCFFINMEFNKNSIFINFSMKIRCLFSFLQIFRLVIYLLFYFQIFYDVYRHFWENDCLYLSCFFSECIKPSDNCINERNEIDRDKDELEQEVEKDPLHAFILNRTTTTMRRQYNRNCILCYTFGILLPIALNTLPHTPDASFGPVTITFKIHFVCVNRQWRDGVHERKSYLSIRILWIVVHCICGSVCVEKRTRQYKHQRVYLIFVASKNVKFIESNCEWINFLSVSLVVVVVGK